LSKQSPGEIARSRCTFNMRGLKEEMAEAERKEYQEGSDEEDDEEEPSFLSFLAEGSGFFGGSFCGEGFEFFCA